MRTALDTNVLSAIWLPEPGATELIEQLRQLQADGLLSICGVVLAETMANPYASPGSIANFFEQTHIRLDCELGEDVWLLAGARYAQYAERRRLSQRDFQRRLLADFIIGAHAVLHADQLMTLDRGRYERDFPELKLV
jgi:predicted nucleic acid-binding protein